MVKGISGKLIYLPMRRLNERIAETASLICSIKPRFHISFKAAISIPEGKQTCLLQHIDDDPFFLHISKDLLFVETVITFYAMQCYNPQGGKRNV